MKKRRGKEEEGEEALSLADQSLSSPPLFTRILPCMLPHDTGKIWPSSVTYMLFVGEVLIAVFNGDVLIYMDCFVCRRCLNFKSFRYKNCTINQFLPHHYS